MDVGGYFGHDRAERMARQRVQDKWMDAYAPMRHIDPILIVTTLVLALVGIAMIYSATVQRLELQELPRTLFASRQLVNLAVGTVAMIVVAAVDHRYVRAYSPVIYLGVLVLLGLVLTPLGVEANGAQRWIVIGSFQLQPSELAKIAVIITLAAVLHERKGEPGFLTLVFSLVLVGVPMLLIFLEPDLGTMLVFVWLVFVLLLVGGMRATYMLGLGALGIAGVVLAFKLELLQSYQLQRLTAFLDPSNESLARTALYNSNQSLIAIGSGQFAGKGWLQGTQTNLSYVPENHTDFIFTVVGEEFGFLGAALVLGLFGILIWRGLRIAAMAKDLFGTLLAAGIVGLIALQVFVNVGMTVGIMPVTGIPLPFISYGGTSLLSSFIAVGLLLNVHMRRF
ncbi:MAG: rod shape-determining protein RodA [Actinobacteria bacterium]|nr:rod shape-determining protein RodA [Actinomycetota bacterium]